MVIETIVGNGEKDIRIKLHNGDDVPGKNTFQVRKI